MNHGQWLYTCRNETLQWNIPNREFPVENTSAMNSISSEALMAALQVCSSTRSFPLMVLILADILWVDSAKFLHVMKRWAKKKQKSVSRKWLFVCGPFHNMMAVIKLTWLREEHKGSNKIIYEVRHGRSLLNGPANCIPPTLLKTRWASRNRTRLRRWGFGNSWASRSDVH